MKEISAESRLELLPSSRFQANVRDWLKDHAAALGEGDFAEKRRAALIGLTGHIVAAERSDPRLFVMGQVAKYTPGEKGWRHREPWTPTISQRRVLSQLGRFEDPSPDDVFTALASAGVVDVLRENVAVVADAQRRQQDAENETAKLAKKVAPLEQTKEELEAERRRADRLAAEVDRVQARAAELDSFIGQDGIADRVPVSDKPVDAGIYRARAKGGIVFEIGFTDDKGEQHWEKLKRGASIEDARRRRTLLQAQATNSAERTPA